MFVMRMCVALSLSYRYYQDNLERQPPATPGFVHAGPPPLPPSGEAGPAFTNLAAPPPPFAPPFGGGRGSSGGDAAATTSADATAVPVAQLRVGHRVSVSISAPPEQQDRDSQYKTSAMAAKEANNPDVIPLAIFEEQPGPRNRTASQPMMRSSSARTGPDERGRTGPLHAQQQSYPKETSVVGVFSF